MNSAACIATFAAVAALGVAAGFFVPPRGAVQAAAAKTEQAQASTGTATIEAAMPNIVAAVVAEGEVDDDGASRIPRPAGSARLYSQRFDSMTTVSVYTSSSGAKDVLRAYAAALKAEGFVVDYDVPAPAPSITLFAQRRFGDSALVTISQGETATLITLVESTHPKQAAR